MPSIEQRRPLRPGGVDLLSPQPPGLVPSELPRAACPINPRPRNRRVYEAACAAAEGEPVIELDAEDIVPPMRAWCGGSFLTVVEVRLMCLGDIAELHTQINDAGRAHRFMLLRLEGDGTTTGWLIGELDTPVYCLA